MYDQSLEQLIDAVIADGVITDQERMVVYNKAQQLGIAPMEIEVYLNGRLAAVKASQKPKSDKHGNIRKCPSCGTQLAAFQARCPECGYEITGVEGVTSVKNFQAQLDEIDKSTDRADSSTKNIERKMQLITNFAVPNSKEDLIEFATLVQANLESTYNMRKKLGTSGDLLFNAWKAKAQQIETKANLLFKNDSDVVAAIAAMKKNTKKLLLNKKQKGGIGCLVFIVILMISTPISRSCDANEDEKNNKEASELCTQIEALPIPTTENYRECYLKFYKITWSGSWGDGEKMFLAAQDEYGKMLLSAYLEAGVSEDQIPEGLMKFKKR